MRIVALLLTLLASVQASGAPVKIIFDTDMDSDCDDVGALAVLHALTDLGEAEILATVVSSKHPWSPACVDVINTYYGRPGLPIGAPKRGGAQKESKYARALADRFQHDTPATENVRDAMDVYREVLSGQPDRSVVIVTVGYLTNVADLLKLPAEGGKPGGMELIERKVLRWVCMGGNFVGKPAYDDVKLSNNNFTYDKGASLHAIRNWPGELVFVGREIGSVPSGLKAGARLKETPVSDPVRAAYELYFGGVAKDRHVADPTTVLYAVRGLRDYWNVEDRGHMDLEPDMTFRWRYDEVRKPAGKQSYLLERATDGKAEGGPDDRRIERIIEELMVRAPKLGARADRK